MYSHQCMFVGGLSPETLHLRDVARLCLPKAEHFSRHERNKSGCSGFARPPDFGHNVLSDVLLILSVQSLAQVLSRT